MHPKNQLLSGVDFLKLTADIRYIQRFIDLMDAALKAEKNLSIKTGDEWNEVLLRLRKNEKYAFYKIHLEGLLDEERWQACASRPQEFNKALEGVLGNIKAFMRMKYGVAASRPTKNALRDARIFVLRQEGLPFPDIAKRFGIATSAAHRAYERHEERGHLFIEARQRIWNLAKIRPWLAAEQRDELPDLP